MSWTELAGVVGVAIGTFGGGIGAVGGWIGARAAKQAADAEHRAADIAQSALRLEHERRHEELGPEPPPAIRAELTKSVQGHTFLRGRLKVKKKDYRVRAEAVVGSSRTTIALDLVLRAGRECQFQIEHWPPDRTTPTTEYVLLRFWPPLDGDGVVPWVCPCDRPGHGDNQVESGHWEWRVPVEYHDPTRQIF